MVDVPLAESPTGVDAEAWAAACAAVRDYCEWHVAPSVTEEVTMDGSGASVQILPTLRLTALISITNDGTAVTDPEWSSHGIVRGCWTCKFRGVVANMTHGYADCPADVLTVVSEMVATSGRGGVSSVTNGTHQVQFDAASFNSQQRATLDRYRLPSRP